MVLNYQNDLCFTELTVVIKCTTKTKIHPILWSLVSWPLTGIGYSHFSTRLEKMWVLIITTRSWSTMFHYSSMPLCESVGTQDDSSNHIDNKMQKLSKAKFVDFWLEDFWSSSSLELNPLDYSVCRYLEQETNKCSHTNISILKPLYKSLWQTFVQSLLRLSWGFSWK